MVICRNVTDYLTWCAEHPDKINEERKLLFKNIVFPTLLRDDVVFDEKTYEACIAYSEHWYYPLFPYQKFIYAFFFMYIDDTPLFRTILVAMGRGNGKDGMMMPLCNFLQTPLYGVENYHIDIVANAEAVAQDSFNVVHGMLEEHEDAFQDKFDWTKEEIVNTETKSKLRFNTSNAKTKYGRQMGMVLFNEYHTYEDYSQINTFTSRLGKIKHPRIVIITTNGYVRGGPLDQLLDVCAGILNGEPNVLKYFPFICKIDSDEEIDKPECWEKANPSMEFRPVLKQAIHDDYLNMQKFPSMRAEFITMRLNLPRRDESMTVASWEKILRTTYDDPIKQIPRFIPDLADQLSVVGIDFADRRDFAAATCIFKIDGVIYRKGKTWINRNSPFFEDIKFPFDAIGQPGFQDFEIVSTPVIDAFEIVRWVVEQMKHYRVVKIIMDSYKYRMMKQAFDSFGISAEDKQNPYGLLRMIRNFPSVMAMTSPVIEAYFAEELIVSEDSALWRWSTNNTGVKIDGNGNKSYFKIDPLYRKNDTFMSFAAAMSEESMLDINVVYV